MAVVTFPKPFASARRIDHLPYHAQTILELLDTLGVPRTARIFVELDGVRVPRRLWGAKRPRPGETLVIGIVPMGGGGQGQDSNKTLRTALLVVVAIVAIVASVAFPYLAPAWMGGWAVLAGGVLGAAISIGGGLLVNQLVPVKIRGIETGAPPDATFGITGSRNVMAAQGIPFTKVYGRHKIFPLIAAEPVLEVIGNDQWLSMVFCCGYGPLMISDIRIADTPILDYQNISVETRWGFPTDPALILYSNDRATDVLGQLRLTADTWTVRTTAPDAWRIDIIVEFPNGIYSTTSQGGIGHASVGFAIQYRRVGGDGEWIGAPVLPPGTRTEYRLFFQYADGRFIEEFDPSGSIIDIVNVPFTTATSQADVILNEATRTYLRRGYSWHVPIAGTHEVRMIRHAPEDPSGDTVTEMYWTVMTTVRNTAPINFSGLALIAVNIRATDQLNGIIEELSCMVEAILPDWDAVSQTWITRPTRNPASAYRDVLQGRANKRPLADRLIDLPALQAWHQENDAAGRTCDYVVDGRTTVREIAATIAAAGRATIGRPDMKYSAVRDLPQTVAIQHFTPRNSWGYSGRRLHVDFPHGIKVVMQHNERKDYLPDEIIAYADGFDASNATLFETIDAPGVVNPDQAYKLGRYHLACAKLRPETHTFNCDFENLRCTRGDLIDFGHDVISAGICSGRVVAVQTDGAGNATGITVDEDLPMEANRRVGFVFRRPGGPSSAEAVVVPGFQKTVTFAAPLPPAQAPAVDDLFTFGDLNRETIKLLVRGITRQRDYVAQITAIPAAPEVHLADQGPIPEWDPRITLPPIIERAPGRPVVTAIRSDEAVLLRGPDGSFTTRVVISITFSGGTGGIPTELIDVRFRRADLPDASWIQATPSVVNGDAPEVYVTGVEDGVTYDFRLRSMTHAGRVSDWTEIRHLVVGKSTLPPDVPMLTLNGHRLVWTYPEPPPDLAGFIIRIHRSERRTWEDAQDFHFGIVTDNTAPFDIEPTGISTYLIKAVDTAGNVSLNAAALIVNLGEQIVENLVGSFDMKAQGWPGKIVNGVIAQGDLRANSTTLFWGPDDAEFWATAGGAAQAGVQSMLQFWGRGVGKAQSTGVSAALFWQDKYAPLQFQFAVLPSTDQVGSDLLLAAAVTAETYRIEYQVSGATLFWGENSALFWKPDTQLFWGPIGASGGDEWITFPGRVRGVTRQVYDIRITMQGTSIQSAITTLTAKLDAPAKSEFVSPTFVPIGGVRLPLLKQYRAITAPGLMLVHDGGSAISLRIRDFGQGSPFLTQGPLVEAIDAGGLPTTGTLTGQVAGY